MAFRNLYDRLFSLRWIALSVVWCSQGYGKVATHAENLVNMTAHGFWLSRYTGQN